MAHFAKIGSGNIVENVVVVHDNEASTEEAGQAFLNSVYGTNDVWKQTSYNTRAGVHKLGGTPFRKNFAGIDFTYDAARDAFIPPRPICKDLVCNSWILNETTCQWEPPAPFPNDGSRYRWDEATLSWEIF
jgi:hypothetical protein